jgi:hypothetical protein
LRERAAAQGRRARGSRGRRTEFPANREKYSEFPVFRPIRRKAVPKSPAIRGASGKIPYAGEQGDYFAEQGIQVPCSAENRDIARLMRRPFDALRAQARPSSMIAAAAIRAKGKIQALRELSCAGVPATFERSPGG